MLNINRLLRKVLDNSCLLAHTLDIAALRSESPPQKQKRLGMARVLKGFQSLQVRFTFIQSA